MVRSFLPVGQGAFYAEQFNDGTNVVYDCGSEKGIKAVNEMIQSTFNEGDTIDAVFISHMHSDHMNGFEFLLKYCNVRAVYLPFLTPDQAKIAFWVQKLASNTTDFAENFIVNPVGTLQGLFEKNDKDMPPMYFIFPQSDDNPRINLDEQPFVRYIHSGAEIAIPNTPKSIDWVYVPYNLENKERKELFLQEMDKLGLSIDDEYQIEEMLKTQNGRMKIRKAYEKVPGGLNVNSLVVYSGPTHSHVEYQSYFHPCSCRCCYFSLQGGCLYLGDFDAHDNDVCDLLARHYQEYKDNIGILQIPHHGSQHNFNPRLLSMACCFVISAGSDNRYKHPHVKVLKEIVMRRRNCFLVTEKSDSICQFRVQGI